MKPTTGFLYLALGSGLFCSAALAADFDLSAAEGSASAHGDLAIEASAAAITNEDLKNFVSRLASPEYEGRGTGDKGERMATAYLASFFEGLGLVPEGTEDSYYQEFTFTSGMRLDGANSLQVTQGEKELPAIEPGDSYQPLSLSPNGRVEVAPVVFGGFGIQDGDYDSFEGLDVEGKWVMVFRGAPVDRKDLSKHAPLVTKGQLLKKLGAAGVIFVKMGNPAVGKELIEPSINIGARGTILPGMTISDSLASEFVSGVEEVGNPKKLFAAYNSGERVAGFALPLEIGADIGLSKAQRLGRNVLARLMVGDKPSAETIMVGAHIDHIGFGDRGGSRASGDEAGKAHLGADDNASGVAAMMEIAQLFAEQKRAGTLKLKRDIVFAGWSGEEMGLRGSQHFIADAKKELGEKDAKLHPKIAAYINIDMVGRLKENPLGLNGVASSRSWKALLDKVETEGLKVNRQDNPYLPTDSTAFYTAGIPVLALFTGLHDDYHKPSDTADKIDYEGLGKVSVFLGQLTEAVANLDAAPDYVRFARNPTPKVMVGLRGEDVPENGGLKIIEVTPRLPAQKAGIKVGDVLTEFDGNRVTSMGDLLQVLSKAKAEVEYPIVVEREGESLDLVLIPAPRS